MNAWTVLFFWIGSQSMQLVFGVLAFRQISAVGDGKRITALLVSWVASIPPLCTLLLFLTVFVIGGSSNVAQLAGESGRELWRLWLGAWPLLLFGNLLAGPVAICAALFPPYPPHYWQSSISRVCAAIAAGFAYNATVTYFPDA